MVQLTGGGTVREVAARPSGTFRACVVAAAARGSAAGAGLVRRAARAHRAVHTHAGARGDVGCDAGGRCAHRARAARFVQLAADAVPRRAAGAAGGAAPSTARGRGGARGRHRARLGAPTLRDDYLRHHGDGARGAAPDHEPARVGSPADKRHQPHHMAIRGPELQ